MTRRDKSYLRKEIGKFSFVGLIATSIDFFFLNLSTVIFGFGLITSNVIASTVSSVASFQLNRKLTFNGQRHGHARTIIRYVLIVGFSVYVIQNVIIYFVGDYFKEPTDVVLHGLAKIGIQNIDDRIVSANVAKIVAVYVGSVWNFILLRRFVFTPSKNSPTIEKD